jgi:hypothetical protein
LIAFKARTAKIDLPVIVLNQSLYRLFLRSLLARVMVEGVNETDFLRSFEHGVLSWE